MFWPRKIAGFRPVALSSQFGGLGKLASSTWEKLFVPLLAEISPVSPQAITSAAAPAAIPVVSRGRANRRGTTRIATETISTTTSSQVTSRSSIARSRFAIWTIENPSASEYGQRSSWYGVVRIT